MNTMMKTLAAATIACVATGASAQNLLQTPGFEASSNPFDPNFNNPFFGWTTFNGVQGDNNIEVAPNNGVWSAKLFGTGAVGGGQSDNGLFQVVPVTPGVQYTASIAGLTPSFDPLIALVPGSANPPSDPTGHIPLLIVDFRGAGGVPLGSFSTEIVELDPTFDPDDPMSVPGPGFTPFDTFVGASFLAEAPAGAVEAQVTILLIQFDGTMGALFVDDVFFGVSQTAPVINALNVPSFGFTGVPLTVSADVADPNGNVTGVEFFLNGTTSLGTAVPDMNGNAELVISPAQTAGLGAGRYGITAIATDNDGDQVQQENGTILVGIEDADGDGVGGTTLDLIAILNALDAFNANQAIGEAP
ncbi:MAG: hypothetical protein AAGI17_07515 [Planctomycetota bacterium]